MEVVNTIDMNHQSNEMDIEQKIIVLTKRIEELEEEKKSIRDEFNIQRAKMKELFLQKEEELKKYKVEKTDMMDELKKLQAELDEARSQILVTGLKSESDLEDEKRKAQEEIASLQQLVHETVEESTSSRSELKKFQMLTEKLRMENTELRSLTLHSSPHHSASESGSLAPSVMISAVTKTLARKLGADTFSTQDNLEESMKKAQEDAEVLRSLVVPLEEEIKALKDKLRTTDELLQNCRLCGHAEHTEVLSRLSIETSPVKDNTNLVDLSETNPVTVLTSNGVASGQAEVSRSLIDDDQKSTGKVSPTPCDMCNNYEAQLVKEQQRNVELEKKLSSVEKSLERQKDDLIQEINFRKDMEEKWNKKKEEHKEQVDELNKRTLCAEQDLQELRQSFEQTYSTVMEQLTNLVQEHEKVQEHLDQLQKENDRLVGKYSVHSQHLQSQRIDLPDDVLNLQELLLKTYEELIVAKVGKEKAEEDKDNYLYELKLLRDQIDTDQKTQEKFVHDTQAKIDSLKKELNHFKKDSQSTTTLQKQLTDSLKLNKKYETDISELRSRVSSLQVELDNGETVQKDFVRLSQSLQVQLEKIRASDTQVRWQHEEDVDECPTCHNGFSGSRKKHNCRHCGQIFCTICLVHTVLSGPNQRPSKVCSVCHTLLNRDTAPYFCTEAPHSPD